MDLLSTRSRRIAPGLLAAGLLLAPLTACTDSSDTDAGAPEATAAESAPAGGSDTPTQPPATGTGSTTSGVDCSGTSCSLTLTGGGAQVDVLGTTISLSTVQESRATVRVGDREVSCSSGESVSAGPLTLECTAVTADAVTLTASLG